MTVSDDSYPGFPLEDEVEDCAGKTRTFVITCFDSGTGFTVRAEEKSRPDGYAFVAFSEVSPYSALYRVRQKMQRGLATRHISRSNGAYQMLHDELSGRITTDGEGDVVLVVDGVVLGLEEIGWILSSHEGWEFRLQIVDALA